MPRSSERPAENRPPDGADALLALHRAALDAMAHGLCVFDAEWRVSHRFRRKDVLVAEPGGHRVVPAR